MGDVINIKRDYSKNRLSTHEYTIESLESILKSYDQKKVNKLFFLHKDISTIASYDYISTLSSTDPMPYIPSDPLIKFKTELEVKKVASDNLIVNNPEFVGAEFSFVNPSTSRETSWFLSKLIIFKIKFMKIILYTCKNEAGDQHLRYSSEKDLLSVKHFSK